MESSNNLRGNLNEKKVLSLLEELDQGQVIQEYKSEKRTEEERKDFIKQINNLEKIYPGGLKEYVKRARILLNNSKNNINPYAKYKPSVPEGTKVNVGDENYFKLEELGFKQLVNTAFVLVAGGLGERLGYDDIKIGIPTELVTKREFFRVYTDYIKAYEARIRKEFNMEGKADWYIPLCIMTSDDTHEKTVHLLKEHNNFGLRDNQIEIVKQEKVPAILDNDCHFALAHDKLLIETKPHGHGDIHTLLHQSGVADRWVNNLGKHWVVFFQDTNALIFNAVPSALGVSSLNDFVINSITIPRKPGEAVGAICKLTEEGGNRSININVEYNQLDSLLRDKYNPNGDVANESGFSDFPGNINVLVFQLDSYNHNLNKSTGLMPEFVNPKYADETKTKFKTPTRLECMMQDYPQLLEANEKVGFTMYDRWFCFSTCKNNLKEGTDKLKKGLMPETAFSVEQDIFRTNTIILRDVLKKLEVVQSKDEKTRLSPHVEVHEIDIHFEPKIVIYPSFSSTLSELNSKVKGKITITEDSTLILNGEEASVNEVYLDGLLETQDKPVEGDVINHVRYYYVPLKEEGKNYEKIRGYTIVKEKFKTDGTKESI